MKRLFIPALFAFGLMASPVFADEHEDAKDQKMVTAKLMTKDGKEVRVMVHPDDVKHLKEMKDGDKVELFHIGFGFKF